MVLIYVFCRQNLLMTTPYPLGATARNSHSFLPVARGHTSRSLHEVENLSEDEPLCAFGKQLVSLFLLDVCQSPK